MSSAPTLAGIALVLALVACALAVGAHQRIARLRGELRSGRMPSGGAVVQQGGLQQVEALQDEIAALRERLDEPVTATDSTALRNVAVVRYDAFGDVGGRLSFSTALVDDAGDGIVISSIHARAESRTYAKGIVGGSSDVTLTPEEQEALAAARSGRTVR